MAIAVWSYPNESTFSVAEAALERHSAFDPRAMEQCFVAMPFDATGGCYSISTTHKTRVDKAHDFLQYQQLELASMAIAPELPSYEEQVAMAVRQIQEQFDFDKVVLSRLSDHQGTSFNPLWPDYLRKAYPNAFISLVSDPLLGTWLTASPELFLKRQEGKVSSFSLAGTKFSADTDLGQKEQEEQSIVTQYIKEAFERSGLSTHVNENMEQKAGNLVHLLNIVEGRETGAKANFAQLVQELHPTPAVGGSPLPKAKEVIQKEGYDRELYTGFLGEWQNIEAFECYVNLRCAQVFSNGIRFYAGAGITGSSNPQKEYLETEAKMAVLKSVLLS